MDIAIRKILPVPEGTLIVVDKNGNFVPSYVREMELLAVTGPATESVNDETTTSPTESVTDETNTNSLKRKIEEQAEMIQNKDKDIADLKNKMTKMESTVKLLVKEL